MNRKEIIEEINRRTGIKKEDVRNVILSFINIVGEKLGDGEDVYITGLGTFYVSERTGYISRDVNTGLKKKIPKVTVLRIRVSKILKKKVFKR